MGIEDRINTTFWMDFDIADKFGVEAIKDTYNRAFNEWKYDYKYLTELSMVLNHKCWQHYENNDIYCKLYIKLWESVHDYALDNLTGKELRHYLDVTD